VADSDSNTDSTQVTVVAAPPDSPEEAIAQLQDDIENLELEIAGVKGAKGIRTSLTVKLNSALAALDKGKNDLAISKLNVFINFVDVMEGKRLTVGQADALRDAANAIIQDILALP